MLQVKNHRVQLTQAHIRRAPLQRRSRSPPVSGPPGTRIFYGFQVTSTYGTCPYRIQSVALELIQISHFQGRRHTYIHIAEHTPRVGVTPQVL